MSAAVSGSCSAVRPSAAQCGCGWLQVDSGEPDIRQGLLVCFHRPPRTHHGINGNCALERISTGRWIGCVVLQVHEMIPDLDFNVITGALSALLFRPAAPVAARITRSLLRQHFETHHVIAVQAQSPA